MAVPDDDSSPSPAAHGTLKPSPVSAKSTGVSAPSGHAIRRVKTMDDGPRARRRSFPSRSEASLDGTPPGMPRRSSNYSDFNFDEARNALHHKPQPAHELPSSEYSSLALLSLAFALLPALAGSLFKNGHSVTTDIMLLGLSGVFLHWSVTQPWIWYRAAQQVRIQQEADPEVAVEEESDAGDASPGDLDHVPEEESEGRSRRNGEAKHEHDASPQQRAALRELYMHEVLALLSCFLLPILSASLLHYIRAQLSRPSEGLVSNYNLTIFLLVSELRAFSHTWKLLQSRTLHLQRLVHENPFTLATQSASHVEALLERVERLEARSLADEFVKEHSEPTGTEDKAALARDVRNAIQPELDALNRAVRRYEKKATVLQHQTESRFMTLDLRLDDAIALAAVAAKNSNSKNILVRAAESCVAVVSFPFTSFFQLLLLPLRSIFALFTFSRKRRVATRPGRAYRMGKHPVQRYSGDGVPSRVMKR